MEIHKFHHPKSGSLAEPTDNRQLSMGARGTNNTSSSHFYELILGL